jgi:ribosomal protein S6--L-glutamate ligase
MVDISPIPQAAIDLALELASTLGIDHAGFDIAMVGGHPYVIEFNRLFGNTGLPELPFLVSDAIQRYLDRSVSQSHISSSDLSASPFGDTPLVG